MHWERGRVHHRLSVYFFLHSFYFRSYTSVKDLVRFTSEQHSVQVRSYLVNTSLQSQFLCTFLSERRQHCWSEPIVYVIDHLICIFPQFIANIDIFLKVGEADSKTYVAVISVYVLAFEIDPGQMFPLLTRSKHFCLIYSWWFCMWVLCVYL